VSTVGEAVCHPVRGIDAGHNHERALEFVVTGFVKEIADRSYSDASARKKSNLSRGAAFAQRFSHRIEFSPAVAEVVVRDGKICALQSDVREKQRLVGLVPETVRRSFGG